MKDVHKAPMYDKSAKKLSEAWNVKNSLLRQIHQKPIRCIETGVVYESVTSAAMAIGCGKNNLISCLKGRSKTARKLHWEYV